MSNAVTDALDDRLNDKFDCFIKLAMLDCGAKDAAWLDSIDDSQIPDHPRMDKKVRKLIAYNRAKPVLTGIKRTSARVALTLLIILSLLFTMMVSISALREKIWGVVLEWYEEYVMLQFQPSTPPGDVEPDTPTPTPPKTIEAVRKPTLIPAGTQEFVMETPNTTYIEYHQGDELIVDFSQHTYAAQQTVDAENSQITYVQVKGQEAVLVISTNSTDVILSWADGEYTYLLQTSTMKAEELIQMAESVT